MARAIVKESQTEHFNAKVPQPLRDKLLELANAVQEDFISDCGSESYGCPNTSAIYGYHISGFIPSQLGGYEVSELYRSDIDSSYHFTAAQTKAMNDAQDYCYTSFASDYSEQLEKYYKSIGKEVPDAKELSYSDFEEAGLESQFSDYENDWFEPALLRFECWVSDEKDDSRLGNSNVEANTIFMRVGLNYLDQPYYRSSSDETLFQFNIPIEEFIANPIEHYIKLMNDKIKKVV